MLPTRVKLIHFLTTVFFFCCSTTLFSQANITIEVSWGSWSSENRVIFRDASNNQIGASICNPSDCFTGNSNTSYNNSGSLASYPAVPFGSNYNLLLEDDYGDGWNGTSYVRVFQDGVLILDTDLTSGYSTQISFDIVAASPGISISDVSVNENGTSAVFTATHFGSNTTGPFTVTYTTVDNSAVAGNDYTTTSGTLSFNGSINDTETITVPILDDAIFEDLETFTIQFTGASDNSVDFSDTAIGTITDDDASIMTNGVTETTCSGTFLDPGSISNYSNNQNMVYTICPDAGGDYISIDFTTFDIPNGDLLSIYEGTTTGGTLIGQYDNSNVPSTIFSSDASGCLTFQFTSNNNTTGAGWQADISCYPDGPQLVIEDITFDEDVGNAIFTVTSTRGRHGFNFFFGFIHVPFTVDFQTVDGSAISGSDYTATSGSLTFNGQVGNVQTISVPISNDGIPEILENFTIEFTGANATFGTVNYSDIGTGYINSQILANDPLTLFQEFDGYYDYSTTGGSLRTNQNGATGQACLITNTSSNQLVSPIPSTAKIEKAYLYWAHSSAVRDEQVTFEGQNVSANFVYQTAITTRNFYGYVSDVTSIVEGITNPSTNTYDFGGLTIDNSATYCNSETVLGGWTLMVFYEDSSLPAVNINLYQGFDGFSNASTTFTLDSFFAIAGSGAKATFLSWEGDSTIDGAHPSSTNPEGLSITNQNNTSFVLSGDGGQPGNNAYNSTIYDNTVAPIYNTATSYGVDLDTYDISTFITPGDSQVTANVDAGQDFVISAAVVLKVPSNLIAGTVFEDVNYAGGSGRNSINAGGVGIQGAIVELFDSSGTFVQRKTTDANGDYSFGGMADGSYSIKVVNATVRSNRGGGLNCSVCYPVQTFRSYKGATAVIDVVDEIGGANPSANQDVTLGVLTNAQSISTVSVTGNGVAGIDFGFNFNTIVNTNESGQGSLAQFIINSNNLDESILDIEANSIFDPAAGNDVSIFMIPPTSDPLGRTADANFASGIFDIDMTTGAFDEIIDDNTIVDGRTQTAYSGDSNAGVTGSGGTSVGVSALTLPVYERPEIQIHSNGGNIFRIKGNNTRINNLAIYADGNAGIHVQGGSSVILNNLIGVNATGANVGSNLYGIQVSNGTTTIDGNYLAYNAESGIYVNGGTSTIIQNNHITLNGNTPCDDNVKLNSGSGVVIQQNLIEDASALGIDGSTFSGNAIITENTITSSGQNGGICSGNVENAGVKLGGNNSMVSKNIIHANGGAGLVLSGLNTSGNTISQNSFYANGILSAALGIDLDVTNNLGDGVTLNENGDSDSGPNGLINFPIISNIYVSGSNLVFEGWSRAGATIEFFATDVSEGAATVGDNSLGLSNDYGEGQTYIGSVIEGSAGDIDTSFSNYSDLDGNTNFTNKFKFVIANTNGVSIGDLITSTATLANSTSEFSASVSVKGYTVITNRRITYRVNKN